MLKWLAGSSSRPGNDHIRQKHRHHRHQEQQQTVSVAPTEIVTDDPLATIHVHKVDKPLEIYAVSRSVSLHRLPPPSLHQLPGVNPIFDDEEDNDILKSGGRGSKHRFLYQPQQHNDHKHYGSPEFPGKSASSGYGSNRYNSSSEYSSSGAEETTGSQNVFTRSTLEEEPKRGRCGEPRAAILRDDAITVLEQNVGFVKSILVAVRGNGTNSSPRASPRKHNRRPSGASAVTLSPIPEGKVDYCIPRPVWPRDDDSKKFVQQSQLPNSPLYEETETAAPDSIVDDALLLFTSFTYTPSLSSDLNSHETQNGKSKGSGDLYKSTVSQTHMDKQGNMSSQDILRELSKTISQAIEAKQNSSPEDVLKGLSNAISLKLESLRKASHSNSSEEALRRLSVTMSHREPLTKMSRALSNSSSSSGGSLRTGYSAPDDTDTARLLLLQRLGSARINPQARSIDSVGAARTTRGSNGPRPTPKKTKVNSVDNLLPHRGSSSSSTSSSGFSDLTRTPPSSSSDSPSSRRGGEQPEVLPNPPVFFHEDLSSVPNSVRNAMIYGTLCRLNTKGNSNGAYEKLLNSGKSSASETGAAKEDDVQKSQDQDKSLWGTYCGTGVTTGDVCLKPADSYYYPSPERPDFTLDMHRAERLMRKIKAAKRRRCWCRVVTSLLGLVFFLMSVMIVSMLLTKGKRVFGPI